MTIDGQSLVLEEHVIIGGVDGLVAISFSWGNDPDWWLLPLHDTRLHCRRMAAQHYVRLQQVNGILHLPRRVVSRNVQRPVIIAISFDFWTIHHFKA